MQAFTVALLALSAPLVLCYDEKYDKVDVDKILGDDAMFDAYTACMLDKGECTLEYADEYRKLLPEVIATACSKCSPIQRKSFRKSVKAIQERKPSDFEEMRKKYDPKGEYTEAFTTFLLASD